MMGSPWGRVAVVMLALLTSLPLTAQTENEKDTWEKQADRKIRKMLKSGFVFENDDNLQARFAKMIEKEQAIKGNKKLYLVVEVVTKHKDPGIAKDLMQFKLPVELASSISNDILQMIETDFMQSAQYWQLGGHDYFLEVQQAIDEVALATALNLSPVDKIYEAKRQHNKNHEYTLGLVYDREKMIDLFVFEAGNYEILDSIFWLTRNN